MKDFLLLHVSSKTLILLPIKNLDISPMLDWASLPFSFKLMYYTFSLFFLSSFPFAFFVTTIIMDLDENDNVVEPSTSKELTNMWEYCRKTLGVLMAQLTTGSSKQ